jgi:hypothetical protein
MDGIVLANGRLTETRHDIEHCMSWVICDTADSNHRRYADLPDFVAILTLVGLND